MNAVDTSVAGSPINSGGIVPVRKVIAGCITNSRYSPGTRSVNSSQPEIEIISLPLPSVTAMSQMWLFGVTPARRI